MNISLTDIALLCLAFAEITLIIDWLQTRYISTHPETFYEINVLLGTHPSLAKVNLYFAIWVLGVGAVYLYGYGLYLGFLAMFETYVVLRNYKLGIKFA